MFQVKAKAAWIVLVMLVSDNPWYFRVNSVSIPYYPHFIRNIPSFTTFPIFGRNTPAKLTNDNGNKQPPWMKNVSPTKNGDFPAIAISVSWRLTYPKWLLHDNKNLTPDTRHCTTADVHGQWWHLASPPGEQHIWMSGWQEVDGSMVIGSMGYSSWKVHGTVLTYGFVRTLC